MASDDTSLFVSRGSLRIALYPDGRVEHRHLARHDGMLDLSYGYGGSSHYRQVGRQCSHVDYLYVVLQPLGRGNGSVDISFGRASRWLDLLGCLLEDTWQSIPVVAFAYPGGMDPEAICQEGAPLADGA